MEEEEFMQKKRRILFSKFCLFLLLAGSLATLQCGNKPAQAKITSPQEQFGHNIGDDYWLANYTQLEEYWKKLDQESDRLTLVEYGKTGEGRTMYLAIITSPENHLKLDRYKEISRKLSLAEGISEAEAKALASEGKAVIWIDGGLHGSEILNSQVMLELVHKMTSSNDPETLRILNDDILLATNMNPDGMELVADWYMRESDINKRSYDVLPKLYNRWVGHDDNRDSYMANLPETKAVNRIQYREWFPQIVYNQHQTGPVGCILFMPPYRDPFNYNLDPLVIMEIDLVGAAMHSRFVAEGKPGAVMRRESNYQTWWNGGVRTSPYFHNQVGILTESKGKPTPMVIPFIPKLHLPHGDSPYPIPPQEVWHFRQSVEYIMSANYAVLDVASRHREQFLYNIYKMGKNSIEKGSQDNWTITPKRMAALNAALSRDKAEMTGQGDSRQRGYPIKYYNEVLRDPAYRDARGYIIPSDQPDFLTATKFVNTLIENGCTVLRATQSFQVGAKTYPSGSYVVKTAQAFRPHVVDMFEPQDYPDDIPCPGADPLPPYDSTGYTLAFQMGVQFDRIVDGFDGPFEAIPDVIKPSPGTVSGTGGAGYLLSHQVNDAIVATNQLLGAGEDVYWLKNAVQVGGKTYPPGTIYIPQKDSTEGKVQKLASEIGLNFEAVESKLTGDALKLKPVRIGLWDRYGGSMPSGWIRWMFETQYPGFNFEVVYPPALDAGNLIQKFDVIIFVTGAIPEKGREVAAGEGSAEAPAPESIPTEYRERLGQLTASKTIPKLREFLDEGGTILAIGTSTNLAYHLNLAVSDHLMDRSTGKHLAQSKYFMPGCLVQVRVDNTNPLAYGVPERLDCFFNNSPVFRVGAGVRNIAWFDTDKPLRSGWGWQQQFVRDGVVVAEGNIGKGKLFLFGPEITFRGQPHGTFKFLFNGIYYGSATLEKL